MKPTIKLRSFLFACGSLLMVTATQADTLYWDGGTVDIGTNGNGLSAGTAGNWNTTLLNWDQGAGLAHVAWNNTNLDTAVFGGTAGNVSLTAPITVGGLTFLSSSGYTLTAGTNGLSFGATDNTIRLLNSANGTTSSATITGTVGGTGNVILSSVNPAVTSTMNFNGAMSGGWSGSTTVNAGMILVSNSTGGVNQILNDTSAININGGTIVFKRSGTTNTNLISDSAAITVNGGGTLSQANLDAGNLNAIETIGAVTVNSGQFNFQITNGGSSGSKIRFNGLTVGSTAAVTFIGNAANNWVNLNGGTAPADTTAGQIIGSWATFGAPTGGTTNYNATPTDYAVYSGGDGTLAAANIGASTEDTWTTATNAYTLSGASTLTGTRTITALRYTGAANTLALDTFNLETSGLLNGGSGLLTVSGAGGALTTASGGGQLHLTTGSTTNNITVSAAITDNSGAVTLVKNGSGTLTLTNTGNSYSGGTALNAGTLAIGNVGHIGGSSANLTFNGNARLSVSADLNFSGGTLTVNQGANAVIAKTANSVTTFANTTGSGNLIYEASGVSRRLNLGDASGFDGNLTVRLTANANYNLGTTVQFSSLGDGVGSTLQFVGGTSDSNQALTVVLTGGSAPVVFDNRQIQTLPRLGSNHSPRYAGISNNNANAANTWSINTDLDWGFTSNAPTNNKEFRLGGSNTGDNAFNGMLSDGTGNERLNVSKIDSGKWILGGDNSYTGTTTVSQGTLVINGMTSTTSAVTVASAGTLGGSGTVGGNTSVSGTLSPGQSPGTLTFSNALTLNSGATYIFEGGDLTAVGGTLTLTDNWILALGSGLSDGGSVTLFTYGTAGGFDLVPTFDITNLGFSPSSALSLTDTGSSIVLNGLSVVPEPNAAALLGALGTLLLLRRRR